MPAPATAAPVNNKLGECLRVHTAKSGCSEGSNGVPPLPLHKADANPEESGLASAALLRALARYPIPVVSAATAVDVGGADSQPPLLALLSSSASEPDGLGVRTASSNSAGAGGDVSRFHSRARRPSRASVTLRVETPGRRSAASAELPAHRVLAAALNDVWQQPTSPAAGGGGQPGTSNVDTPAEASPAPSEVPQQAMIRRPSPRPSRAAPAGITPPAWAAASPFRFCADPSFHTALERVPPPSSTATAPAASFSSTGALAQLPQFGSMWSVIDARCHGFSSACATHRKRVRTAASTSGAALLNSCSGDADRRVLHGLLSSSLPAHRTTPQAAQVSSARRVGHSSAICASSPQKGEGTDALQSRIADNDELLDLLLHEASADGEGTGVDSHAAGRQPNVDGDVSTTSAMGHLADALLSPASQGAPTTDGGSPHPPRSSLEGLQLAALLPNASAEERYAVSTVKTLKEACMRHGLLATGSRRVLEQRLRLYRASAAQQQASVREVQTAGITPSTSHDHAVRPPPNSTTPTTTTTTTTAPTATVVMPATMPAGYGIAAATRPAATGSPPRTIFRYRSPSQPPAPPTTTAPLPTSHSPASLAATSSAAVDEQPPAKDTAAPCRRRLVPSPTQFLQELAAAKPLPPTTPFSALCGAAVPSPSTAADSTTAPAAGARAAEEELKGEMSRVRWQWLVDFRERAGRNGGGGRQHDGMLEVFRKQQVPCTSVALPAGDFALAVELLPEEAGELAACVMPSAAGPVAHASAHDAAPTSAGDATVFSHVCAIAVERKTIADLDASVKGVRYSEQRRLLTAAPYRCVVWLIEGTNVSGGYGTGNSGVARGAAGSRSPSPSTSVESARQRVDSACASLGLHSAGWLVVRTRSTAESVHFLKLLATQVARQLADYRLHRRTCASGVDGLAALPGLFVPPAASPGTSAATGPSLDALFVRMGCRCCPGEGCTSHDLLAAHATPALRVAAGLPLLCVAPTQTCLRAVATLHRYLRAKTAFPRMLMCIRGCSAALAAFLSNKYGSLLRFWRELRQRGREACDADADVQRLSTAQKKVYVLLTEFLLARDYF